MSENNVFEIASRCKFRFDSSVGKLTVEDLWDIHLTSNSSRPNLDAIAKDLNRKIKDVSEESFVVKKTTKNLVLENKFKLVKYIISVKLDEIEQQGKAAENKLRRDKIRSILAQKQDAALSDKSVNQLEKELRTLED